ncbi:hypothetical protein ABLB96_15170 [Acinetobacter sp. XH1741]|uniref:hypothetical protein n=1 Tax=unclassified Acinetobacter TaxID=196816 RepID=UPI0032B3EFD9
MIEAKSGVEFDGNDIWLNGDLISKCDVEDKWLVFGDIDTKSGFESLEEAIKFCLEQKQ